MPPKDTMHVDQKVAPSGKDTPGQQPAASFGGGKYKSAEELDSGYSELNTKFGQQGTELGNVKAQNEILMQQLSQNQQQAPANQEPAAQQQPAFDYQGEMASIVEKMGNDEITPEEAIALTSKLTATHVQDVVGSKAQETLAAAQQQFNEALQQRDDQAVANEYLKEHPDFAEMKKAGALAQIMEQDPLVDEVGAYWRLKATQAFDEGKATALREKEGSADAAKIINDPGTSMQTQPKDKVVGELARKQSMIAAAGKTG